MDTVMAIRRLMKKKAVYQIDVEIHLEKNVLTKEEVFQAIDEYRKEYPRAEIKVSKLSYKDGCVWSSNTVPDWKFHSIWKRGKWRRLNLYGKGRKI
jgi:hypothetical protein